MRLRVKKQLKGGEYFVSLENVDFNFDETEKIEKFGMPSVDFTADGLGTHQLNDLNVSFKCQSADEAERMVGHIQQDIRNKLTDILAQVDNFSGEEVVEL
ncbi:MAG: hypothetical protein WCE90_10650 [Candidatus Zixiibacteriota bacterium]|jgi:hypothetical protein